MIQVVQLTDTHLYADPAGELYHVNTRDCLQTVIQHAQKNVPDTDFLLVTGDLVHDESQVGYDALKAMIQAFGKPAYYLPGNHDDPEIMRQVLPNVTQDGLIAFEKDNWSLVLLDSSVRGQVEGVLSSDILEKLAQHLNANSEKHVLVALHHHVIDVKSEWLDALNLRNNHEFFDLLDGYSNVRVVINGHIHQELDERRLSVRYLGTPATCFQFAVQQKKGGIDDRPPGYRHIVLHENGRVDTKVYYVDSI